MNVSVSALATDNESKMRRTRRLYIVKYPSEGSIGCAPHAADLIAGDILKHPCIGPTVKLSRKLQDKLKNTKLHQFLAIKIAANRADQNPSANHYVGIPMYCSTRWNSFCTIAEFQTKHKWVIGSLSYETASSYYMNDTIRQIINTGTFWNNIEQIKTISEPVSTTVTALQADTSCSSVYYYWNRMERLFTDNDNENVNDTTNVVNNVNRPGTNSSQDVQNPSFIANNSVNTNPTNNSHNSHSIHITTNSTNNISNSINTNNNNMIRNSNSNNVNNHTHANYSNFNNNISGNNNYNNINTSNMNSNANRNVTPNGGHRNANGITGHVNGNIINNNRSSGNASIPYQQPTVTTPNPQTRRKNTGANNRKASGRTRARRGGFFNVSTTMRPTANTNNTNTIRTNQDRTNSNSISNSNRNNNNNRVANNNAPNIVSIQRDSTTSANNSNNNSHNRQNILFTIRPINNINIRKFALQKVKEKWKLIESPLLYASFILDARFRDRGLKYELYIIGENFLMSKAGTDTGRFR